MTSVHSNDFLIYSPVEPRAILLGWSTLGKENTQNIRRLS